MSSPDQTLTLGCEIINFYPPNISVTWLKLREGERDDREEEVIEGGDMWGPLETHPRNYRATATLKRRAANQEKERRGGIICRVEHCSLHEPIERHWRNVDIGMNHYSVSIFNINNLLFWLYLYNMEVFLTIPERNGKKIHKLTCL